MTNWIGRDRDELVQLYEMPDGRKKLLYFPAYFEMISTRLCVFGGRAVSPDRVGVAVIEGKRVLSYKEFSTYEEARAELAAKLGARIVSNNPLRSCVPLRGWNRYRLVHSSPEVSIYEFRQ